MGKVFEAKLLKAAECDDFFGSQQRNLQVKGEKDAFFLRAVSVCC